jgi:16S rRNA (guanine966-N2)-methyltransferase
MRVISGKFKGRRLKGPHGMGLRPTGGRLKETLFNILGTSVAGAVVLDAFAGAGAIGIEALSRGAREVVYIESGAEARRLVKHNLELCGIKQGFRIVEQDIFMAMRSLARSGCKVDIVYFDPPYNWKLYHDLLDIVFKKGLVSDHARVVIEHHRKADIPESGEGYVRSRIVRQGDHCLSFFIKRGPEARSEEPGI